MGYATSFGMDRFPNCLSDSSRRSTNERHQWNTGDAQTWQLPLGQPVSVFQRVGDRCHHTHLFNIRGIVVAVVNRELPLVGTDYLVQFRV